MGRKHEQGTSVSIKLPRGVSIRHNTHGDTLQIYFAYRGRDCRETLKLSPTKSNIAYARNRRGEILIAIEKETFRYSDYFPDSKRARLFGHNATNTTIGDLLADQLKVWEKSLQLSTVRGYRTAINAHLVPQFGKIRVQDLTPGLIREWVAGLTVTMKRVRNILTPLKAVLENAVNDDLIERNPLDKVVLNKLLDKNTRKSTFEVEPFEEEEIHAILGAATPQCRNLLQFAFATGLRTGELIALRWSDIDWAKRVVHVSQSVVERVVKAPKTKAGVRDVVLSASALDALEKQKSFTLLQGGRVFHNPRTKKPWVSDAQIRRTCWIPVLRNAGVRYRNPYQTRHTFASALLSDDKNPLWVATQMGHETVEMVTRHYGRWLPDYGKEPTGSSQVAQGDPEQDASPAKASNG